MKNRLSKHQLNCIAGALYDVMMRDNEVHDEEKIYFNKFLSEHDLDIFEIMYVPRRERFATLEQITLE